MRYISILLAAILVSACGSMYTAGDSSGSGMDGSSASGTTQYQGPLHPGDTYFGD